MHTMSTSRPDGGPAGAAGGRIGRRWGGTVQASNRSAPRAPRRPITAGLTHLPTSTLRKAGGREGGIGSTQARGAFLREAAARARRPWAGAPLRAPPLRPAGPRRPRRRSHPPCTSAAPSVHTPSQDPSCPPDPPRLSRAVRCAALDAPGRWHPRAPHRSAPRAPAGRGGGPTPPARAPRGACTPPHRTRPVRPTRRGFPARCGAPRWKPVRKGCLARPRPTARRAPPPTRERLAPCTPV